MRARALSILAALTSIAGAAGLDACGVTAHAAAGLTGSSSIASGAERTALMRDFARAAHIPAAERGPIITCLIGELQAHGITTHGQFSKVHNLPLVRALSAACTVKVLSAAGSSTGAT